MLSARAVSALVIAVVVLAGCGGGGGEPGRVSVEFRQGRSSLVISAEIASTPDQRALGLMGRASLGRDQGMLFLFPSPTSGGFWMKNTLIPLDIAFISGRRVVEVRSMTPCTADPCPLTTPADSYDRALEVGRGVFTAAGISAGASVAVRGTLPEPSS